MKVVVNAMKLFVLKIPFIVKSEDAFAQNLCVMDITIVWMDRMNLNRFVSKFRVIVWDARKVSLKCFK